MNSGKGKNPKPCEIELSPAAEVAYLGFRGRASRALERGETTNYHISAFNIVNDAFRLIQTNPEDRKYALTGELSCIYRIKKGRMRICWVVAPDGRICVLFISETPRKDGDAHDPYAIFTKMVMSGQFDNLFDELGVGIPKQIEPYRLQ
jgi:mRNA-degrading endonuclease RelE of RelBE toxin-antitoxin system